jgi:hypothetical protein
MVLPKIHVYVLIPAIWKKVFDNVVKYFGMRLSWIMRQKGEDTEKTCDSESETGVIELSQEIPPEAKGSIYSAQDLIKWLILRTLCYINIL